MCICCGYVVDILLITDCKAVDNLTLTMIQFAARRPSKNIVDSSNNIESIRKPHSRQPNPGLGPKISIRFRNFDRIRQPVPRIASKSTNHSNQHIELVLG